MQVRRYGLLSGGKTALLQRFAGAGGRRYTAGQQALDLALLGQQQSSEALKQARRQVLGVGRQFETAEKTAQAQAQEAQARAAGVKELAQKGIAEQLSPLEQTLAQRAEEQTGAKKQELESLQSKLQRGEISKSELDRLGLSELADYKGFYGAIDPEKELSGYFSPVEAATKAGVASQAEAGKMSALGKLAGRGAGEFADVSTAGKYAEQKFKGAQENLLEKIKAKSTEYEGKAADINKEYTNITKNLDQQAMNNERDLSSVSKQLQDYASNYYNKFPNKFLADQMMSADPNYRKLVQQQSALQDVKNKISQGYKVAAQQQETGIKKLKSQYKVMDKYFGQ